MRRPEFIARQGRCPSGWLGRLIGRLMAKETLPENRIALRLLGIEAGHHVLEVGFGHGRSLAEMAKACPSGRVAGVDASSTMMRMAAAFNRDSIEEGRMQLYQADSAALPLPSATFDRVLSVHTIYFWGDPLAHLREVRRVMTPGGRFVLGYRPESSQLRREFPAPVYRFRSAGEVQWLLAAAGFLSVEQVEGGEASRDAMFAVASA